MNNAESIGTDWRSELLKRVDIAANLENQIEQLLKLLKLDGPLGGEDESQVEEVRLNLNRIAIQLHAEPELLNDAGEQVTMVGWSLPINRYQYFRNGASRFLTRFKEMEAGIYNYGLSNWGHNRKYASKFQSAGADLRAFIAAARAMLTDRDYHTCRQEIQIESLEQKRASRQEQARMIQAVADKLRADSEAAKRADIEDVINSLCGPPVDHVTLQQCAAIIKRSKRTLERWKTDDTAFPTPGVLGGEGRPDEWSWSSIRPYLEQKAGRKLPAIFPAHASR